MLHDTGAFTPWGIVMPYIAAVTVPGPYVMPTYKLDVTVALTNKVPTGATHGALADASSKTEVSSSRQRATRA